MINKLTEMIKYHHNRIALMQRLMTLKNNTDFENVFYKQNINQSIEECEKIQKQLNKHVTIEWLA